MKYKVYTLSDFRKIPQMKYLTEEQKFDIEVVGNVLPFKVNNYVINELIDWNSFEKDPCFILTFPQKNMLSEGRYQRMAEALKSGKSRKEILQLANEIRMELNPNPAGQLGNIPMVNGQKLKGVQHKYRETVLFFPSQGQTCHAYCTFCFRWPQFTGIKELKFAMSQGELVADYIEQNPQVTDLLFTGGDPMTMKSSIFEKYIDIILDRNIPNLQTIRIGTKTLAYWPYRYTEDEDAEALLRIFEKITARGINLSVMAHFNHINELQTEEVRKATKRILSTGAQIRTQSPVLKNINDDADMWAKMWRNQVNMGMIPYYMFIARETGAQEYFALSLEETWNIYREAYSNVSGICRTVRGPSMSASPGKIQVKGVSNIQGEKVYVLSLIQSRNPDLVDVPFFAKYRKDAYWIDELEPAFTDKFIFE